MPCWYLGSNIQTAACKALIYVNSSDFIIALSPATRIHVSTRICCVYANLGYTEYGAFMLMGIAKSFLFDHVKMITHEVTFSLSHLTSQGLRDGFKSCAMTLC